MGKITLVIGGARSGKSTFAENYIKHLSDKVMYIATAVPLDESMVDRIKKHVSQRPTSWVTVEQYKNFETLYLHDDFKTIEVCLLDCVTIMVTNLMFDRELDYDAVSMDRVNEIEREIGKEVESLLHFIREGDKHFVLVSNEVGLGVVPPYKLGNYFRDIAGRINQKIAQEADDVYFLVSGIPMKIK